MDGRRDLGRYFPSVSSPCCSRFSLDLGLIICHVAISEPRSGVVLTDDTSEQSHYTQSAYKNDVALGIRVKPLSDVAAMKECFPSGIPLGPSLSSGFLNSDGGWAWAAGAISRLLVKVKELGAEVRTSAGVKEVVFDKSGSGRATGVKLTSGEVLEGDSVIIATGSWTPSNFPGLGLSSKVLATGSVRRHLSAVRSSRSRRFQAEYRDHPTHTGGSCPLSGLSSGARLFCWLLSVPRKQSMIIMILQRSRLRAGDANPRHHLADQLFIYSSP